MPGAPAFSLGRYWIGSVEGSGRWYRFWYDAGVGEIRRRSLGTTDLEQAKIELAAIVLTEGSGQPADPKDVAMIAVLTRYWEGRSDHQRGPSIPRAAGRYLFDLFGNDLRVGAFTRTRQIEFMEAMRGRGFGANYIARLMSVFQAALNFAVATDDDDKGALLLRAPKLIYQPKAVAAALNVADPEPNTWHPDIEMIARFLDGLDPEEEFVKRWAILIMGFCCRAEAAIEAGPFQLIAPTRTIRLNPYGRRQNKKHRPTIPVPDALWPLLTEDWAGAETFVASPTKRYPYKRWNEARDRLGLPVEFTRRSLRHFMATELRHAHVRYGVQRVPADEREMMMGHRRLSTNDGYGTFDPEYLSAAKAAVEATLQAVNAKCKKPFLRQGSAKPATRVKLRAVK